VFIRLSRSRHRRRLFRSQQAPSPAADLSYSRAEAARIATRPASGRDSSDLAEDRAHLLRIVSAWTGLSGANAEAPRWRLYSKGDGRQSSRGDAFVRQLAAHPLASIVGSEPLRDTGVGTNFRAERAQPREFAAPLKPASPNAVAGSRARGDPMPIPVPPSGDGQLNFNSYAAAVWADRLRSFYEALPEELAPNRHWDLLLEIAVNAPEARMEDLRVPRHSDGPSAVCRATAPPLRERKGFRFAIVA
jgi:hypothetical protein